MNSRITPYLLLAALGCTTLFAQQPAPSPAPAGQPAGQKTLAATLNVYAFPTKGQKPEQQSADEAECYQYAVTNTGNDPFELQKKAEQTQQQKAEADKQIAESGKGAGAKGALGGAAAGALIGEIASDDPGEGAAWGAAVGGIAARRKAKSAKSDASKQVEQQSQQAQQATAEQVDNFKKAFSVCLEAKNYMVKY
jgi:hypothetical protein